MPLINLVAIGLNLLLASASVAVQSTPQVRTHAVSDVSEGMDSRSPATFDFQHNGPLEFLTYLKEAQSPFSVAGLHVGWLNPSDVRPLLDLVSSKEPCAFVVMSIASTIPRDHSTIGQEALFLLNGIRQGTYPPTLHSHSYDKRGREAIIQWARKQLR